MSIRSTLPALIFIALTTPVFASAATYCPHISQNLQYGARDARTTPKGQVSELQNFIASYYARNTADVVTGYFGPTTRTYVKKFQCEKMGLCSGTEYTTGYGRVGPGTRAAMVAACTANTSVIPKAPASATSQTGTVSTFASTTSSMSTALTPVAPPPAVQAQINLSKPHFNSVWIEPTSFYLGRLGRPTAAELRSIVQSYKGLGINTVVVAYSEFMGCFFYDAPSPVSYYSYYTNSAVSSSDPGRRCFPVSDGDFIETLLDEADKQGIDVIVGLSDGGDVKLNLDLYNKVKNGSTAYVSETSGHTLNDRISQSTNMAVAVAKGLQQKYGKHASLKGWYIPHEESECLDSGNNIYTPIADALKAATPGKKVMISPTADVRVCFNSQTYTQALAASHADIVAYQDAVGAGYRVVNGSGAYYWTDSARDSRISEITQKMNDLKAAHQSAGTEFWINTELWRMDGTCPTSDHYGCEFPATWDSAKKQLSAWSAITPNLMLNQAYLQFDFRIQNAQLTNEANRARAQGFTDGYKNYLSTTEALPAPIPAVSAPTPTPVVTITADEATVVSGGQTTVSWRCLNTSACTILKDGQVMWSGAGNQSSAFATGPLVQTTTYAVRGTLSSGQEIVSSPLTVTVSQPALSISITAEPKTVSSGASAMVTWSALSAASCTIATNGYVWYTGAPAATSAFPTGNITQTSTYTLSCKDSAGVTKTAETTVVVQ